LTVLGATEQEDGPGAGSELPELANVYWRQRVDERSLRRADRLWTASTVAHELPFLATAVVLPLLNPVTIPVAVVALAHAWAIPELYASRGAGAVRQPSRSSEAAESRALGLLGDLVGHDARELLTQTGMVLEPGRLGVWLVAGAGALLVRPGGRRAQCYCVRATSEDLPRSDRVAHLLLALRADESGFATVANLTFSGSCWRLRRRLDPAGRQALQAGVNVARRALSAGA
jgi:hypothetical protein